MNNFMKLILLSLFSIPIFSMEMDKNFPIAKVLRVRGNVTILPPHSMKARKLKKGEMLLKDSSVLVKGSGFTKISFINKSILTVGPNSKAVIEMDLEDKTSLVSVISGKIRAKVNKDKKGKLQDKKFLVKTRSATMGVRGTDFQVVYEPKSKRTSLLTYEGRVDIAKPQKEEIKTIDTKNTDEKVKVIKKRLLDSFESVEKGDFTNVTEESDKVIKPVKINAAQYALLKRDETLGAENKKYTNEEKEVIKAEVKKLKVEFNQAVEKRKEDQNIKELGLVDTDSGLYVPPADSELNKLIGELNDNGDYIPPKGVKVDSQKGLIVTEEASEEVAELVEKAQETIKKQAPKLQKEDELDPNLRRYFQE